MQAFLKPLSAKEEARQLERMRAGCRDAREILIEHNLRLVAHIVKKYNLPERDADDFISIGTIGLIKAIDTFNPGKNIRLATYASRCIDNAILSQMRLWLQTSPQSRKEPKWRVLAQVSENIYILCSTSDGYVRYAPM